MRRMRRAGSLIPGPIQAATPYDNELLLGLRRRSGLLGGGAANAVPSARQHLTALRNARSCAGLSLRQSTSFSASATVAPPDFRCATQASASRVNGSK